MTDNSGLDTQKKEISDIDVRNIEIIQNYLEKETKKTSTDSVIFETVSRNLGYMCNGVSSLRRKGEKKGNNK